MASKFSSVFYSGMEGAIRKLKASPTSMKHFTFSKKWNELGHEGVMAIVEKVKDKERNEEHFEVDITDMRFTIQSKNSIFEFELQDEQVKK
ncbi:unnamed protein product [Arabis nemorensis]|uniref:Uncharacterized protein n=1 Tax=Arabis nemorensis TaxID=586526 RepID=A0A565B0C2_9BRAS|nr:unnamed protein product [Arabis nemorensis]